MAQIDSEPTKEKLLPINQRSSSQSSIFSITGHQSNYHASRKEIGQSRHSIGISNRSSSSSGERVLSSLFQLGLENRVLTLASIHIGGLDSCFENNSFIVIVTLLSDVFDSIIKVVKKSHAFLGNFENNRIILSWNSTFDIPNHERNGLQAAFQILESLKKVKETKWKNMSIAAAIFKELSFDVAMTTQECACGNIGTQDSKVYSINGSYLHNLDIIQRQCIKMEVDFICSENVYEKAKNIHLFRYVKRVDLYKNTETESPHCFSKRYMRSTPNYPTKLYQVGESTVIVSTNLNNINDCHSLLMNGCMSFKRRKSWIFGNSTMMLCNIT